MGVLAQIKDKSSKAFAIKSKSGVRYEVGDLVTFSMIPRSTSHGRIIDIMTTESCCKLEIHLLDNNQGRDLVDCPSSPKIVVEEGSLQGNLVLLCCGDFDKLGYVNSNIFNRVEPDSQGSGPPN